MSRRRTSLKKIRKILKYSLEGIESTRRIADRVGISHTQVSTFLGRLSGSEYSFEELIDLNGEDSMRGKTADLTKETDNN